MLRVVRLLIVCAAAVASCYATAPTARVIMAPDGYAALLIQCHGVEECLEHSAKKCPRGYDVLDREKEQSGTVATTRGNVTVTRVEGHDTLLIRCNGGVGPNDGDE